MTMSMWISIHVRSMSECVYQFFQSGRPGPTCHLQVPTTTKEIYSGDPRRTCAISMGRFTGFNLPSFGGYVDSQLDMIFGSVNGELTRCGDVKFQFPVSSSFITSSQNGGSGCSRSKTVWKNPEKTWYFQDLSKPCLIFKTMASLKRSRDYKVSGVQTSG